MKCVHSQFSVEWWDETAAKSGPVAQITTVTVKPSVGNIRFLHNRSPNIIPLKLFHRNFLTVMQLVTEM